MFIQKEKLQTQEASLNEMPKAFRFFINEKTVPLIYKKFLFKNI
jgi:hypothetical protein